LVWSGHSCTLPLILLVPLTLTSNLSFASEQVQSNPKVKGGGQECPPHTSVGE